MVEPRSKPCPLCGATPHHGLGKVEHCQLHGEPFQRFSIWCPKGHVKVTAMDEAAARAEWDQRPSIATLEQDNAKLRAALEGFISWAQQKCPCENEKPNPCTLCGVSVESLEGCKAVDATLPRDLLAAARTALHEGEPQS